MAFKHHAKSLWYEEYNFISRICNKRTKDLFHGVQKFTKVVVRTEQVKQVMKLGFVNLAKKTFVNLDVEIKEKRVPLNQKSKLNHESISSSTWKLGTLDCLFCLDTPLFPSSR
jgi:hypothetical protein